MALNQTVEPNLLILEEMFTKQTDYLHVIQKLQGLLDDLVRQTTEIPFWKNEELSLEELAVQIDLYDWYRCVACCSIYFDPFCNNDVCVLGGCTKDSIYYCRCSWPTQLIRFLQQNFLQFKSKCMTTTFFLNYVYYQLKGNLFSMYKICS